MSIFKKVVRTIKAEPSEDTEKTSKILRTTDSNEEYEIVEIEILPEKMICPDCGGITLVGLDFCDKCGGELITRD